MATAGTTTTRPRHSILHKVGLPLSRTSQPLEVHPQLLLPAPGSVRLRHPLQLVAEEGEGAGGDDKGAGTGGAGVVDHEQEAEDVAELPGAEGSGAPPGLISLKYI